MHKKRHHDHHFAHRRRAGFPGGHGDHGFAEGGWGGFGPGGSGGWFGPGRSHGGPGRARKGDVRSVILMLLADGPSNGYGLIKAIQAKTAGFWRPSPGSIYPTLQQLVDEGLIQPTAAGGTRPEYELTDEGRSHVAEHREHLESAWNASSSTLHEHGELLGSAAKLAGVVRQVAMAGTAEQRTQAATKLDELRRELYRMLGE